MDFSSSMSRKHPAESSSFATPQPASKRRRTAALSTPVPQNLLRANIFEKSLNSSFSSVPSSMGVSSTAPRLRVGAPSTPGARPTTAVSTTSGMSDKARISEPATVTRSFAPKPLQSPFAARSMRNRKPTESSLRFMASLRNQQSNGISTRHMTRADSVASPAISPPRRQSSVMGVASSTGARGVIPNAAPVPAATPARRIHNPNFRSERKLSPKPVGSTPMFQFRANSGASRSHTPAAYSPFFSPRAQTPIASSSNAPDSRLTSFASQASTGETKARADGIISFFSSSIEKAKQALAGNRADRNEERKQKEKEAVRKKMEEEQRIKRDELFRQEMLREQREREEEEEVRDRMREEGCLEDKGKDMDWLDQSGVNGNPSFVTEDTIPDTPNGFHTATFVEESVQYSSTIVTSSPAARIKGQSLQQQMPTPISGVAYPNVSVIAHDIRDESSEEESEEEQVEVKYEKPKPLVISLDSDDEEEEAESINPVPKFLFSHPRRLSGGEANEEEVEEEEGEYDEYAEYEEYDEEETGEYDEEEEEEEEEEEVAPSSAFKSKKFIDEDEAEEVIEQFGEAPAESDEEEEEASYIEEETEKDETDNEDPQWGPKVRSTDNVDCSLDSTVVIDGPSQQNSFSPMKEVTLVSTPPTHEGQENTVPEIIVSSPAQAREPTPVSPDQEQHPAEDKDRLSPSRSPTPTAASPPAGLVIIDDDVSGGEPQESSPGPIADIEEYEDDKGENAELEVNGRDTGIYQEEGDVYNRHGKHIGSYYGRGYVYADIDEKVIGWISAEGRFHILKEKPEQNTRLLSRDELHGRPSEDTEYEVVEDDDEGEEVEKEEEGDEIEADFQKALEEENEEEGNEEEEEIEVANEQLEKQLMQQIADEAYEQLPAEQHDESMYEEAPSQIQEPESKTVADDEPLIEEEEQIGVDFHDEHDHKSTAQEVIFTPAKEGKGAFFHFHHAKEHLTTPKTPKTPYRLMSNDELSRSLRIGKDGRLVVKSPSPELESDEDAGVLVRPELEDIERKSEEEVPIDPALSKEMGNAPIVVAEENKEQPEAVTEVEVTVELEAEIEAGAEPEIELKPNIEAEENKVDITMETYVEEPSIASIHHESVVIIESEDEGEDEGYPTLLPDSVHDRSSVVRELFREGTVEEQVIEWQNGGKRESYHRVSITVEEEGDDSESEMEEEGAVEEEAPVNESVGEEVEGEITYPKLEGKPTPELSLPACLESIGEGGKLPNKPMFGFNPPIASLKASDSGVKLAATPLFGFKPPTAMATEVVTEEVAYPRLADKPAFGFALPTAAPSFILEERLPSAPVFEFTPPTSFSAAPPSEEKPGKLPSEPVSGFTPIALSEPTLEMTLATAPTFEFKPPTASTSSSSGVTLATAPVFTFTPPTASLGLAPGMALATAPVFEFKPPALSPPKPVPEEKLPTAPLFGFTPPTTSSSGSAPGGVLATAPAFEFKPPTASASSALGVTLVTAPLFGFKPSIAMAIGEPTRTTTDAAAYPILVDKSTFGFTSPTSSSSFSSGEKLSTAPLFEFKPPTTIVGEEITKTGAEVDVEDGSDSDTQLSTGEEANVTVDLGLGGDGGVTALMQETVEDERSAGEQETAEEVLSEEEAEVIPTAMEDGKTRESTLAPERERTATPPPLAKPVSKKRKRKNDGTPTKQDSIVQPDNAVTEENPDEEMGEGTAPPAKSQKKRRKPQRNTTKKRRSEPKEQSEPEEEKQVEEPQPKKRRTTRQNAPTGSTGTSVGIPTPTKGHEDPYLEDEKMEQDLRIIETAIITALDPDVPPEETVQLRDGSVVPAIQPEEAGVALGKELRDGKIIEPPKRATRKRGRSTSVEPTVRSTTRSTAKKTPSVKEPSPEPENEEPEDVEPVSPPKKTTRRRGRSASVEPLASFEELSATKSRAKKASSVKESSAEPPVPSEDVSATKPKAKRAPSVKEPSVEPEATGEADTLTLRNRKVVVNRQGSVDLSADDTDRSTNTVRRSARHRKTSGEPSSPPAKENVPMTPKTKRVRKQPVMSAIKEADVEASGKKVRRSRRKDP